MDDYAKSALDNMKAMLDIIEKVTVGEMSQEDAVQKILALTSQTTLDSLDSIRKQADDVALAYAAGDFKGLPMLLDNWVNATIGVSRGILMQIENANQFGVDGKGGL